MKGKSFTKWINFLIELSWCVGSGHPQQCLLATQALPSRVCKVRVQDCPGTTACFLDPLWWDVLFINVLFMARVRETMVSKFQSVCVRKNNTPIQGPFATTSKSATIGSFAYWFGAVPKALPANPKRPGETSFHHMKFWGPWQPSAWQDPAGLQADLLPAVKYLARCKHMTVPPGWEACPN